MWNWDGMNSPEKKWELQNVNFLHRANLSNQILSKKAHKSRQIYSLNWIESTQKATYKWRTSAELHITWQNLSTRVLHLAKLHVFPLTFYPNLAIFLHRYICAPYLWLFKIVTKSTILKTFELEEKIPWLKYLKNTFCTWKTF